MASSALTNPLIAERQPATTIAVERRLRRPMKVFAHEVSPGSRGRADTCGSPTNKEVKTGM
jgi:hypothetical protein